MKFPTKLLGTYIAYSWGNLWGTTKKVRLTIFRRCVQNCTLSLFPSRQTSSLSGEITYSHYDVKQFACAWLSKTPCHLASRGLIFRALSLADSKQRRSYWKDWTNYKNCFFFSNRIHVHQISRLFVLVCHVLTDVVQHAIGVIMGKICIEDVLKWKLLLVSGRF